MKIVMFTIADSFPIIGNVLGDDNINLTVDRPLVVIKEGNNVMTYPYMPFAKDGVVVFLKNSIVAISSVEPEMEKYYEQMHKVVKDNKMKYTVVDGNPDVIVDPVKKLKTFH